MYRPWIGINNANAYASTYNIHMKMKMKICVAHILHNAIQRWMDVTKTDISKFIFWNFLLKSMKCVCDACCHPLVVLCNLCTKICDDDEREWRKRCNLYVAHNECVCSVHFIFEAISIEVFVQRQQNATHKPFKRFTNYSRNQFFLRSSLMLDKMSKAQILIRWSASTQ